MSEIPGEKDLVNLIQLYLQYQRKKHPSKEGRWNSFPDLMHILYSFGDWDTFEVQRTVSRMVETGEIEKSPDLRFRWKIQE